jgi:hypothetical protein
MDEFGGPQRVALTFEGEPLAGQRTKLLIHQRQKAIHGLGATGAPVPQ